MEKKFSEKNDKKFSEKSKKKFLGRSKITWEKLKKFVGKVKKISRKN